MATNKRLIKSNDEGGGGASFNTVTYTGTGPTPQSISGVGFQPDFVWGKIRSSAGGHFLHDSVRGATKFLQSNTTNAEGTATAGLTSFDADGFSLGTDNGTWNSNGDTFVAWNFKAGGAAVTNTDGTITSQVSANTEAGFSIVSYTGNGGNGQTVGHGLGITPSIVITKNRDKSGGLDGNWAAAFIPNSTSGYLNTTNEFNSLRFNNMFGSGTNTNTFTVSTQSGTYGHTNGSGDAIIAYCFAEVAGFSKFGSYPGTGAAGNFQDCGFEPAFVMVKRTDGTSSWYILDNKRDTTNPRDLSLSPDLSDAEGTVPNFINFEPTGFSMASAAGNGTGQTWIYMAFANQF